MAVTIRPAGKWCTYRFTGQGKEVLLLAVELRRRIEAAGGKAGDGESDRRIQQARRRTSHRVGSVSCTLLLLFSVFGLYIAEAERKENAALRASGIWAKGEVIRLESGLRPQAECRFTDARGNIHTKAVTYPRAKLRLVKTGDPIEILYLPDAPEINACTLEEPAGIYMCMGLILFCGAGSLVMTALLYAGCYVTLSSGQIWLLRPGETVEDRLAKNVKTM